ncbi:MAG: hypothetical protein V3V23_08645, partial [Dehalococcoidales bacterium]
MSTVNTLLQISSKPSANYLHPRIFIMLPRHNNINDKSRLQLNITKTRAEKMTYAWFKAIQSVLSL